MNKRARGTDADDDALGSKRASNQTLARCLVAMSSLSLYQRPALSALSRPTTTPTPSIPHTRSPATTSNNHPTLPIILCNLTSIFPWWPAEALQRYRRGAALRPYRSLRNRRATAAHNQLTTTTATTPLPEPDGLTKVGGCTLEYTRQGSLQPNPSDSRSKGTTWWWRRRDSDREIDKVGAAVCRCVWR